MTRGPRFAAALAIAGYFSAMPQIAWAGEDIRASADVTATTGYSSNPFAEAGTGLGSPYVQIDADPELRWIRESTTFTLHGRVNYQHYFRDYSDASDYQGGLDYAGMPTSRLTTHASVSYDSSIVGALDRLNPVVDATQPQPPPTTGPDILLFGSRLRRKLLAVNGDLAYTLSDRDSVTASAFYDASRYGVANNQGNYDSYGGTVGYSRRISEPLRVGAQASINRTVYNGFLGNSQIYSLQATVNYDINGHWRVNGAAGASYSDRSLGGKKTSPTGNIQVCRVGSRTSLCLQASEAVLPTGFAGPVVSKSAGLTYTYQLSERSKFLLSGSYSQNDQPADPALLHTLSLASSYAAVTGSYDRTLRERIHVLATARYRSIMGGGLDRPADIGGSLGISVRLGDYR